MQRPQVDGEYKKHYVARVAECDGGYLLIRGSVHLLNVALQKKAPRIAADTVG